MKTESDRSSGNRAPVFAEGTGVTRADEAFLGLALAEAEAAARAGEVPVGAVLVHDGRVLACAQNETCARHDPTAHAELLGLREAARRTGYERLLGVTCYTTLEPCFMCAGALVHARVERVVFAARDPKFGAVRSLAEVLDDPRLNHQVEVHEVPAWADASRTLLQDFFREQRRKDPRT